MSRVKFYLSHSHNPHGRDLGSATIYAASCSGGTTDMGLTFSSFGKRC
jgi:hypothetical protein